MVGSAYDSDKGAKSGSAYVYERQGPGVWMLVKKLVPSDGGTNDEFGWAVSIDGGDVLIGARYNSDKGFKSGSAYIYDVAADCDNGLCVCKAGYSGGDCSVKGP